MRVLFVSPAAELGGAERCLLDCVAALRDCGAHADIEVLSLADGPLLGKARELGAGTCVVEPPRELAEVGESGSGLVSLAAFRRALGGAPAAAHFVARARRTIADFAPDVVHTNGMKAHLLAGLVAPARSHLVVHLHDFIGARRASRHLLPLLAQARSRVSFIANSKAVARDFVRIAPNAKVRTIYNVVDTGYFSEGASEPEWLAGLAGLSPPAVGTIAFGLVATYARWKGHRLFIEAAGRLRSARPETPLRFYVVGGPIYKTLGSQVAASELLDDARSAGIESCFGLVPFQDDIARVYRALDVVVHASTEPEPFGRTIVEAMACERAVVVSRAGGALELFRDGENALGFEPGSGPQLAETMARALDPALRARIGSAARAHAVANFGNSRLGAELVEVYAGSAPSRPGERHPR
jgi:glycosyltransferase involved in cell wall biosynthesis